MIVFILSFVIIAVCILGMSLSLIYGRGPIKGSCGATEDIPGFDEADGCIGACGKKHTHELDTEGHHSCRRRQERHQNQAV